MASAEPPRSRWAAACYWALVGALAAFGVAGIMTIGVFFVAAAAALALLARGLRIDRRGLPGLAIGAAVIPFYLAILNRSGPGTICTHTATTTSCGEQSSPWSFVGAGVMLLVIGVLLLRRRPARTLRESPYPPR